MASNTHKKDTVESSLVIELHGTGIDFLRYNNGEIVDNVAETGLAKAQEKKLDKTPVKLENERLNGLDKLPNVQWENVLTRVGSGLNNPGINICYMNVIIQVISHTPFLSSALIRSGHTNVCPNYTKRILCVMCLLENHVKASTSSRKPLNNPFYPIAQKVIWLKFKFGQQDDAFIFLKHFLNSLIKSCYSITASPVMDNNRTRMAMDKEANSEKETRDILSTEKIMSSAIGHLFGGFFKNVIVCEKCKLKSEKVEPFFDIPVHVNKSNKLIDLLSTFLLPEKLICDNKYFCKICKSHQNADKSLSIYKSPRILNINLKRFNVSSHGLEKSTKAIEFPQSLSLSLKHEVDREIRLKYQLYAIVCHIGKSLRMGHYITYIKGHHGFWYCFDDSNVRCVSESKVFSQKNDVYLLFYSIVNEDVLNCDTKLNKFSQTNTFSTASGEKEHMATPEHVKQDHVVKKGKREKPSILTGHRMFSGHRLVTMMILSQFLTSKKKTGVARLHTRMSHKKTALKEPLNSQNSGITSLSTSTTESKTISTVKGEHERVAGNAQKRQDNKKRMATLEPRPGPLIIDQCDLETWSDAEEAENYNQLLEKIHPSLKQRDQEDIEYDRGKLKKVKTNKEHQYGDFKLVKHKSGVAVATRQKDLFDNATYNPIKRRKNNKYKRPR
ncbi:Ubiquitin carboxyl-terminal hydrolase family member protein [Theileria equi strain WA]|uniref:ubiquitinyl hydrolase 1 n=1 Tax=Theileria equi strain WA TaxID=1537102 RepID=L0AVE4_THEEQ|nr:Ubiquitin carboxyl-terminal hydrolase family member protein [Theileria equi strain WA]AFZ79218.1 Ubiquitin carboxyl-terminal hydrolase family member protein [Theileria equi strain WA]|eukprot:XP_004828884.1 Ubiquitin carboxyl-terminal hydrolase family member protein [Theileria equi strain WA]